MARTITVFLVLYALSGCASFQAEHHRTLLLDRSTGETRECTVAMKRTEKAYEAYQACIRSYEEQGYSVWSQY